MRPPINNPASAPDVTELTEDVAGGSHQRMVSVGTSEILKYLSLVAIEHEEWPACAIEVKQHLTPRCLDAIRELGSKLTAYANDKLTP